jgi:hypothetical protein
MSCHVQWSRDVLDASLTKTFVNGQYKAHRENILLDREIALLPASQHVVTNYKIARDLHGKLKESNAVIRDVQATLNAARREQYIMRRRLERIEESQYRLDGALRHQQTATTDGEGSSAPRAAFIRTCPVEECRGFLSSAWKCGTCGIFACASCHEIIGATKDAPHECTEENLATARLLRRDSKPCPCCAAMITKIEGCDQMYCVQCHTAFSWRTGLQVRAGTLIHNPHYYEHLRQRNGGEIPRAPGDVPCGGIPGSYEIDRSLRRSQASDEEHRELLAMHRIIRHIENVEMPRLANQFDAGDNMDLRLQYLVHAIDRQQFKTKLVQREKRREKELSKRQVYDMMCAVSGDAYRKLINGEQEPARVLEELRALRSYTNECLKSIQKRFECAIVFF